MKARHVWMMFAFLLGIAVFATEMKQHWLMLDYGVWTALAEGASATAFILGCLAFVLSWDNE